MAADKKKCVTSLSIDICKVFNASYHALLMQKLKEYGYNDTSLKVSSSFFDSKRNRVRLQHAQSKLKEQPRGCLPASKRSVLMHKSDHLIMYADDHQVYTNCTTLVNATMKLKSKEEEI